VHLGFLLLMGAHRHRPHAFFAQVFFVLLGLAFLSGLWCGISVVDDSELEDIISFSSQSLSCARRSLSWDTCSENVCVTLPLKSNSYVHDLGLPCPLKSMVEAWCVSARVQSPVLRLHCRVAYCVWRMLNQERSTTTVCTTEGRPTTRKRNEMPLNVTSPEHSTCWSKAGACCFFDPNSSRHFKSPEAPMSFRTEYYNIQVRHKACSPTKRQEG